MPLSDERRASLVAARTATVARDQLGLTVDRDRFQPFAGSGAAAAVDGRGVVDLGNAPGRGLGAALVWATRVGVDQLDLIVDPEVADRDAGVLARQASWFDPAPRIWRLSGVALEPVEAVPHVDPLVPPPSTAEHALLLRQAGLEVVIEQGEVIGERRGLEVARVVIDPDGSPRLEIGIGRFDREAFALLHGDVPAPEALARVIARIDELRRPGAEPHPMNRLVRERWLRHQIITTPGLLDAASLEPVEGPTARHGLRDPAIAAAVGQRSDGRTLVVAASVGMSVDAVSDAADTRARHVPDADLVVVVPTGDLHPVTTELCSRLVRPAEAVELTPEWAG